MASTRSTLLRLRPRAFLATFLLAAGLGGCAASQGRDAESPGTDDATAEPDGIVAGTSSARFERLSRTLAAHVERGELAGVASLVARHGEVVHFAATGGEDVREIAIG